MVTRVCEDNFKLYDPSTRYELLLDSVPRESKIAWKSLLNSYQGLIAKHLGQQVPVKGLLANHEPSGRNTLFCGQYRDGMIDGE
jgi:hypothetical protein